MKRVFNKDHGYGTVIAESWMDKSYLVKWDYKPMKPQWIEIRLVKIVEEA